MAEGIEQIPFKSVIGDLYYQRFTIPKNTTKTLSCNTANAWLIITGLGTGLPFYSAAIVVTGAISGGIYKEFVNGSDIVYGHETGTDKITIQNKSPDYEPFVIAIRLWGNDKMSLT